MPFSNSMVGVHSSHANFLLHRAWELLYAALFALGTVVSYEYYAGLRQLSYMIFCVCGSCFHLSCCFFSPPLDSEAGAGMVVSMYRLLVYKALAITCICNTHETLLRVSVAVLSCAIDRLDPGGSDAKVLVSFMVMCMQNITPFFVLAWITLWSLFALVTHSPSEESSFVLSKLLYVDFIFIACVHGTVLSIWSSCAV